MEPEMTVPTVLRKAIGVLGTLLFGDLQERIYRESTKAYRSAALSFPARIVLPKKYGKQMSERVVELLLARLSYSPGAKVLDVGYANIQECHRKMLLSLPQPSALTGIDIGKPMFDASLYYDRTVREDITHTSFESNIFDRVWCISTLEHIGFDNSQYVADFSVGENMVHSAVDEMVRVVKPGGSVLITVPYGKWENHGWFQNMDKERWEGVLGPVRSFATVSEWYFRYTKEKGWGVVRPEELSKVGYDDQQNSGAAGLAAALITKRVP